MTIALLAVIVVLSLALVALAVYKRRPSRRPSAPARRILFPFVGRQLSQRALDATLRIAKGEGAVLVPAYLAEVPMHLPMTSPLPRQCDEALPVLEAVDQRAAAQGVVVDPRIERGRTLRHAFRQLVEHESFDRIIVTVATDRTDGFSADDVAWILRFAPGEVLVLRPEDEKALPVTPTLQAVA